MKTFEQFLEEYDWNNVSTPTSRKYTPKLDIKHSYMTGITQPGGGNITFTPGENEEIKTNKKKVKNANKRTTRRTNNKVHLSKSRNNRNS